MEGNSSWQGDEEEFREARMEDEANDGADLVVGSIDTGMEEDVDDDEDVVVCSAIMRMEEETPIGANEGDGTDEDISSAKELLAGPNVDEFEETNGITRQVVIRYDPICDHTEIQFNLGMRFESYEQFKFDVQNYAIINGFDIFGPGVN